MADLNNTTYTKKIPGNDVAWRRSRQVKTHKHGPQCLPFIVSEMGALDDVSAEWIRTITTDIKFNMHMFIAAIVKRVWHGHARQYRMYFDRIKRNMAHPLPMFTTIYPAP